MKTKTHDQRTTVEPRRTGGLRLKSGIKAGPFNIGPDKTLSTQP